MSDDKKEVGTETTEESGTVDESPSDSTTPEATDTGVSRARRVPYTIGIIAIAVIVVAAAGFYYMQHSQENANEARNRLAQGWSALADDDLYMALYQFERALKLDPELPGAHAALGQIAIALKQGSDAVNHFKDELVINPDDKQSHLALGCLYSLGCVQPDDPHQLRAYLLSRYPDVIPFEWPVDLVYLPDPDIDPLTQAVYHFHYALEYLPLDPTPLVGLALTDIAIYDLAKARERLSGLIVDTEDEATYFLAHRIIEDINEEEVYSNLLARAPEQQSGLNGSTSEDPVPGPLEDYTDSLEPIPPITIFPDALMEQDLGQKTDDLGVFGSRSMESPDMEANSGVGENNFGHTLTLSDLTPQPTVKPISNDIPLANSNEWIHTVRIANIYQPGSVGFREGEIIVMPNTNTEVRVVEASDDNIILEENGNSYLWVPGEVGWILESSLDDRTGFGAIPPGITVHPPEEDNDSVGDSSEDNGDTGDSDEDNGSAGSDSTDEELGPEVPSE